MKVKTDDHLYLCSRTLILKGLKLSQERLNKKENLRSRYNRNILAVYELSVSYFLFPPKMSSGPLESSSFSHILLHGVRTIDSSICSRRESLLVQSDLLIHNYWFKMDMWSSLGQWEWIPILLQGHLEIIISSLG